MFDAELQSYADLANTLHMETVPRAVTNGSILQASTQLLRRSKSLSLALSELRVTSAKPRLILQPLQLGTMTPPGPCAAAALP